jgi:hypothetical protein
MSPPLYCRTPPHRSQQPLLGDFVSLEAPARHTPRGRNGEVGSGLREVHAAPVAKQLSMRILGRFHHVIKPFSTRQNGIAEGQSIQSGPIGLRHVGASLAYPAPLTSLRIT